MNQNCLTQLQQAWADLMSDDVIYSASISRDLGDTWHGKTAVLTGIQKMLAHDDADAETGTLHIAGDHIFNTWTYRSKKSGNIIAKGCDLFRFKNGLIVYKDAYRKVTL